MNKLTIYTYGGWSFSGSVVKADKNKLTIKLSDGANAVIFKKHVVAMVDQTDAVNEPNKPSSDSENKSVRDRGLLSEEENQTHSFIPADMLIREESKKDDDDFSMSFSNNRGKNLTFKLEGEE